MHYFPKCATTCREARHLHAITTTSAFSTTSKYASTYHINIHGGMMQCCVVFGVFRILLLYSELAAIRYFMCTDPVGRVCMCIMIIFSWRHTNRINFTHNFDQTDTSQPEATTITTFKITPLKNSTSFFIYYISTRCRILCNEHWFSVHFHLLLVHMDVSCEMK